MGIEIEPDRNTDGNNFSAAEKIARTLAGLEQRLPTDAVIEQLNLPRPGKDRYPEFKPQVNDQVIIYRSDGREDSGWVVDQILSRPGNLTVAGLFKTEIGPKGPRRLDKVLTTDSFAALNINIEPEIQTDKGGDQFAIKDYLRAQGRLKD